MNFLQRVFGFGKKPKLVTEILPELTVGDLVYLEFRHPREVGIISGDRLTCTRLNNEELKDCKIKGSITKIWKEQIPLKSFFVEVASYSSPATPGQVRKYLFIEDEIKEIKKV